MYLFRELFFFKACIYALSVTASRENQNCMYISLNGEFNLSIKIIPQIKHAQYYNYNLREMDFIII